MLLQRVYPQMIGSERWKKNIMMQYTIDLLYIIYTIEYNLCIYIECVCWSISFGFQTESRFYWWTPDDSFIQLKPTQVLFPPNNAYEWSQSIYTTGAVAVPVVKLNSYDISSMSPTLAKLVENSELDLDAVNSMMLDKVQNSLTREQAACAWLKSNEDRWKATRLSRAQCRILELQTQVCYSLLVTRCYSHHNASPRRSPSWVSQCVSSTISRNCMHYWQQNKSLEWIRFLHLQKQRHASNSQHTRKHFCKKTRADQHGRTWDCSVILVISSNREIWEMMRKTKKRETRCVTSPKQGRKEGKRSSLKGFERISDINSIAVGASFFTMLYLYWTLGVLIRLYKIMTNCQTFWKLWGFRV